MAKGGVYAAAGGGGEPVVGNISRNVTPQVAGKFKLNNEGFF